MTPERKAELRRNVRPWNSDIDQGLVGCLDEIDRLEELVREAYIDRPVDVVALIRGDE